MAGSRRRDKVFEARPDAAAVLPTPSFPPPVQRKRKACNTRTSQSLLHHFFFPLRRSSVTRHFLCTKCRSSIRAV